ncbi:hypothetical protein CKY51_16975 [Xanthomonas maliensis]|nr:hypothetical protein CKY51_16975 [Xanthomonas maliensis]
MAALLAPPAMAVCQQGPFAVALPAQRLDERLQQVAHITGCFVEVEPALLAGRRVGAVEGQLSSEQLFLQTIRGSGLEVHPVGDHWQVDRVQQQAFADRIAVLERRLVAARDQGAVSRRVAAGLRRQLHAVDRQVLQAVRTQGFLSAAERVSQERALDAIAQALPPQTGLR